MNSPINMHVGKSCKLRGIHEDSERGVNAGPIGLASGRLPAFQQAFRKTVRADTELCATESSTPTSIAAYDHGYPPVGPSAGSYDPEPPVIRIVEGTDSAMRRGALSTCLRRLGGEFGQTLMLFCRKGAPVEFNLVVTQIEALQACLPGRPVFVGVDDVDQSSTSLIAMAFNLRTLLNDCAAVVCTGNAASHDFRLLTFYLRMFGVKVIRESVTPEHDAQDLAVREHKPFSRSTEGRVMVRRFPRVRTPALDACMAGTKGNGPQVAEVASVAWNEDRKEQKHKLDSHGVDAIRSAWQEYWEKSQYASAYRNAFALHRLQREWIDRWVPPSQKH